MCPAFVSQVELLKGARPSSCSNLAIKGCQRTRGTLSGLALALHSVPKLCFHWRFPCLWKGSHLGVCFCRASLLKCA